MEVSRDRDFGEGLVEQRGHLVPVQCGGRFAPTQPQLIDRWVVDRSQQRSLSVDESDRRAPVRDAGQEVVGTVDGIDVPGSAVAALRAPSSPTRPSSGRFSASLRVMRSSAAWSAADTTSEIEVL